jgi:uncharacterized phage infection (PIP) family protein YhgE
MEQFLMSSTEKKPKVRRGILQHVVVIVVLATVCGCQTGEPTARPGDEALNFAQALKKVEEAKEKICKAFEQGTPDEVHDTLHQVGHLLEDLPQLATQGRELSTETVTEIQQSVESLFDGFGKLDDTMHGGAEVELDKINQQLTQALANLQKVLL